MPHAVHRTSGTTAVVLTVLGFVTFGLTWLLLLILLIADRNKTPGHGASCSLCGMTWVIPAPAREVSKATVLVVAALIVIVAAVIFGAFGHN